MSLFHSVHKTNKRNEIPMLNCCRKHPSPSGSSCSCPTALAFDAVVLISLFEHLHMLMLSRFAVKGYSVCQLWLMHSGLMLSCPLTQPHLSSLSVDKSITSFRGAIKTLLNCSLAPSELQTHPAASQRSSLPPSSVKSPVCLWNLGCAPASVPFCNPARFLSLGCAHRVWKCQGKTAVGE